MAAVPMLQQASPDDEDAVEQATDYVTLKTPQGEVETEETADGGLMVTLGEAYESPREEGGFYENLAEVIPDNILNGIATDLLDKISEDQEARKQRDKQYQDGLRRTGMGADAPGGASFPGASKVVHPMLTEATIDFASRIMSELWPPSGPVKSQIIGEPTREKDEKAKRKADYMNYDLTIQIKEARDVIETMLTQLPLGGSQFIKVWQDHRLKRKRMEFVPVDRMLIPKSAQSFHSATRRTFVDRVTQVDFQQRVEQELYRDLGELAAPSQLPDETDSEKAIAKIEGVEDTGQNIDGERVIYEVMEHLEITSEMAEVLKIEKEDTIYPYLISIDEASKQVLSFYRCWDEKDDTREPIEHIFEFQFLPWRGALKAGLPHVFAGLPGAATGALRALLDSAHIATMQGGFMLKGSGTGGQTKVGNPTEFTEIDSGPTDSDDIRKRVMPFPVVQPSEVLFQLLGFCVDAAKSVVRTTIDDVSMDQANSAVPVGTQLSRVQEGLTVYGSIHGRTHTSFNRMLMGMHRLDAMYLPNKIRIGVKGKEIFVRRRDFEGPMDVCPTSDPVIFSDQQRMYQIAAIEASAVQFPQVYNVRAVQLRKLKLWKIADPELLLVEQPQPQELNAVNENLSMALGRPVVAFPEQDHLAHIQTHLDFAQSPILGMNPLIGPAFMPAFVKHMAEHIVYLYAKASHDLITYAAGVPAAELMSKDNRVKGQLDRLIAQASQLVVPGMAQVLEGAMPILQQAIEMVQKMMPPPMMDPAQAAIMAAKMETERRGKADTMVDAREKAKIGIDAKDREQKNVLAADASETERRATEQRDAAAVHREETQRQIASDRNRTTAFIQAQRDAAQRAIAGDRDDTQIEIAEAHDETSVEIAELGAETQKMVAKERTKAAKAKPKPKPAGKK